MAVVKTWMETDALTDEKYVRRRDKVYEIDAERTTEVE
jgi:ribose 5-phosphate isomerase B